jgi:hypothetical protein
MKNLFLTRNNASALERLLRKKIFDYEYRQSKVWKHDYGSEESYIESVSANRSDWKRTIKDGSMRIDNTSVRIVKIDSKTHLLSVELTRGMTYQALFAEPEKTDRKHYPLLLCLHGIGGSPEMVMGADDALRSSYHDFGRTLTKRGYAVLIPALINNFADRAKINRMALLLDANIWGLEIGMIRTILEAVLDKFPIEGRKIGAWGISMGGAYVLYSMPIEDRIRVGIISAWFNHRLKKMIVESDKYSCFLPSDEEHAFLPGLLTQFSDSDLVSLICPRPLHIQTGEQDTVSHAGLVSQEVDKARIHYERLNIQDRFRWLRHPGGHEIDLENGLNFLDNWL